MFDEIVHEDDGTERHETCKKRCVPVKTKCNTNKQIAFLFFF